MRPSPAAEPGPLAPAERQCLLGVARAAIEHGLEHGRPLVVRAAAYPEPLRAVRASFVTLRRGEALRGCIGTCVAVRPMVEDVARHAYAAAFEDPRFPPLTPAERADLHLHLSLLTAPQPLRVASQAELLAQVRPGVDGLLLQDGFHQSTLLPSVWEVLPDPAEFVRHLKLKAGLPADHWSPTLSFQRYTAESVS